MAKTEKQKDTEILVKIQDLIGRAPRDWDKYHAATAKGIEWPDNPEQKRTQAVMEEAEALDRSVGPGLKVGRLVHWPVADGNAMYFLTRIGKRMVELEHFPWGDAWRSPVVVNGRAMREAVEQAIRAIEGMRRIFGSDKA